MINRRVFLGATAALLCRDVEARNDSWQPVITEARKMDQCYAISVYKDGTELLTEVFRGPPVDQLVPIKSVSKSIVAALAGAAIDRGEIYSTEDTLGKLIPDLIPSSADAGVSYITVENLLTMQAGLERTSGRNYNVWVTSADWIADALSRPIVAEPGTRMLYSTGSTHVLGAILSEVSGQSLLDLARTRIGQPLGIEIPAWTRDPQGRYLGGNEMALTLDAMVRFGELYRNSGRFEGVQVLSEDWVERSFEPVTRSMFSGLGYGYGWFLGQSYGTRYALARGYGGQIICVVPQLALTVAITSDPNRVARTAGYFGDLLRLIENTIIPVART